MIGEIEKLFVSKIWTRKEWSRKSICTPTSAPTMTIVAYTCLKVDKGITDALVHLRKKKGAGGVGRQLL